MRSAGVSRPTERRMRPSVMPRRARSSGARLAWVMVAGWVTRDSTVPRFSARLHSSTASITRLPASAPPRTSQPTTAP